MANVHLRGQDSKAQDCSRGDSAPPPRTSPAAPCCQPGEAGRPHREGLCHSGGPQPHLAQLCMSVAGVGGTEATGPWDAALSAQLGGWERRGLETFPQA